MNQEPDIMRAADYVENLYAVMKSKSHMTTDDIEIVYLEDLVGMLKQLQDEDEDV